MKFLKKFHIKCTHGSLYGSLYGSLCGNFLELREGYQKTSSQEVSLVGAHMKTFMEASLS
jgi:hypothetical protein